MKPFILGPKPEPTRRQFRAEIRNLGKLMDADRKRALRMADALDSALLWITQPCAVRTEIIKCLMEMELRHGWQSKFKEK
jgi:hypothetical protein